MAIGLVKEYTRIGIAEEITEGTYVAPVAATSFVQPLDGFSITPTKEEKTRNILTSGLAAARSRVGQKSVEATISVEMRASGIEGGQTDFHSLIKSAVGGSRLMGARVTSETGHSTTEIYIADGDIADFNVGDIIVVLEAGLNMISPIVAVDSTLGNAKITLLRTATAAYSDNVEIAKFQTYYTSNTLTDFPTLSMSFYHGNEINEKGMGMRASSMALANFTTGEIAQFDFAFAGIKFNEVNGAAPFDPNFDPSTPPLILSACLYKDAVNVPVNNFAFSFENTIGFITSTCSEDGRISSRFSGKRAITGTIDPYKDDTSVANFTNFVDNTPFSLFAFAANPSGVDGEYELGSVVGFYFPSCVITAKQVADLDGVLKEDISFRADGGEAGEDTEFYMGMI